MKQVTSELYPVTYEGLITLLLADYVALCSVTTFIVWLEIRVIWRESLFVHLLRLEDQPSES